MSVYAITNNDFALYQYLIKEPILSSIFYFKESSPLCDLIESYLEDKEVNCLEELNKLRSKFEIFIELHLNEYHDIKVKQNTHFFGKALKAYYDNTMNIFFASINILVRNFPECCSRYRTL